MNKGRLRAVVAVSVAGLVLTGSLAASVSTAQENDQAWAALASDYQTTVLPLMKQFCLDCHSTQLQEGELDLERFAAIDAVRQEATVWQRVVKVLDNGEMPPKEADAQPSTEQRKQLRAWVERYLHAEAFANAGDPGPVVLRRLSNAEYTYTIRDLTGVELNPADEFPGDGAAGEGFTNTGNSLTMSPALLSKYLDAGKEIAGHAVLLPSGFRFSPSRTRSDWTHESLEAIRQFYSEFTGAGGGVQVNLQGVQFETNRGGRLQVQEYLAATLAEREALRTGTQTIAQVARQRGLNEKYLGLLWETLNDPQPTLLLAGVQARWRVAEADQAAELAAEIGAWQDSLFRFSSVGHIGKLGGPTAWQETLTPLAARQEVRVKLPELPPSEQDVTLYLVVGDAGDGAANDFAIWERPRIVAPGRPDLLLRDVRSFTQRMIARRQQIFAATVRALAAAEQASRSTEDLDVAALAKLHDVDPQALTAWLEYLGIGSGVTIELDHFTNKLMNGGNYEFVRGWGAAETPNLYVNSSNQHVRIPGNLKPRGVVVHPSPELSAAIGWQSPLVGTLRIEGQVTHAHPECGNGVVWSLELRRGAKRQRLATGVAQGGHPVRVGPIENLAIQPGDLISLLISPRDSNHACDLTDVELVLTSNGEQSRQWNLTRDVTGNVHRGNPLADQYGHEGVWHFYTEPVTSGSAGAMIPAGSLLARWQTAEQADEKHQLALAIQELLTTGPPADADHQHPDVELYRQLVSLGGLLSSADWHLDKTGSQNGTAPIADEVQEAAPLSHPAGELGLDPARFGRHPDGSPIDAASLCVKAPTVLEVRLPADLIAGAEFVTTGRLHPQNGGEGSVQFQVLTMPPGSDVGLVPAAVIQSRVAGAWTSDTLRVAPATPVIVDEASPARQRYERSFDDFRQLFPVALCYTEIVPVDEVVTLTLFYREDQPLRRLMLNDEQARRLDDLWEELHFISGDAVTLVDAFEQLLEYASQDGDPKVFEPLRKPIYDAAANHRQRLIDAEPKQLDALKAFAARAYRRPLMDEEAEELDRLYHDLRGQEFSHEEAFRFALARIFIAPAFLYRLEQSPAGTEPAPVSDFELASRLSYFLWSSQPDEELLNAAASGTLHQPEVLIQQSRRMLNSPRIRRLATEFACQWLQIYDFDLSDDKSNERFPEFTQLRDDMYEEAILFFTDLFRSDRSVLSILDADHAFLNESLAEFYTIPLNAAGEQVTVTVTAPAQGSSATKWHRVEGVRQHGRGGVLGLSATLAKHSGASRTSPILRGTWISDVLLGEKLPNPPPGVPPFPEANEATQGLTVRELTELHTSDPNCAGCHMRVDPFGFALEHYDAIGRYRDQDSTGRPLDTQTRLPDGTEIAGHAGLREYLLNTRRDAVLRQFCRKLLGYSLGRAVQLSDEPLLTQMHTRLTEKDYRFSAAVDVILQSRQFQEIRGRDVAITQTPE